MPTATGHNGGRSQIQTNFPQVGGDFAFVNLMLLSQDWSLSDNSGWPSPSTLNSDGYPTSISNGGVTTLFFIPTQTERSGNYVLITTGIGTVSCTGLASPVSVSGTNTQTTVSAAILGSNNSVSLTISATDATTPITKMAFVHNQDVAAYLADNLAFGAKFIATLQQANCGVIRFLNWQNGNFTNETNWASRKPLTHWSFATNQYPQQRTDSGLGCQVGYLGQTTSVKNDYSISDSGGTAAPVQGQTILLNFDETAVTVASGANAQISWTSHGLVTGSPFVLYTTPAGSAPGGITIYPDPRGSGGPTVFYAIVVDANHIKFASTYANAIANVAMTTSSTGSGVSAHATVIQEAVTLTSGSTNVAWPHHLLTTGDPVILVGNSPATNVSVGINYYAIVIDADNIKLALTRSDALANTAITFAGSGGAGNANRQPTLNLNGTGAVPIRDINSSGATDNFAPYARAYQTHVVYGALTYDAGLNAWIKVGADQATTNAGIGSYLPPEVCLSLCAQVGAHPYFVSGFHMLEPLTDYMPSLMKYCKDNGQAWMIPRFEVYNENWNTTPGSSYAQYKAWVNWSVQQLPAHDWVGKTASTLAQAAAVVWPSGKGTQYQILVGVQSSVFVDPTSASQSDNRLAAAQYVAQAAAVQSPLVGSWGTVTFTKTPAYQWCTHVCCTQYITPSLYGSTAGTPNESTMAATWTANGSLPNDPLLTQYVDTLAGASAGYNLAATNVNYVQIYAWAQGAGVTGGWGGTYKLKMCGYEGGYSPSLFFTGMSNVGEVYAFRRASKMVADVGISLTGGTFVSGATVAGTYYDFLAAGGEFPSCFQLGGAGDGWAVLDPDIYVSPQPSQWSAIVAFNQTRRAISLRLRIHG